jgi:ribosomal-protein-alanine N-acetyltransferase
MINNFEIVEMNIGHLDGVMIVENLSFKIPWSRNSFLEELTKNNLALYFVAISNGQVIGYGGLWKIFDEGHITNIAVHPEFRLCKVASGIIEKIFDECDRCGIKCLTLEVRKSNIGAQKLYSKYGFKIEGTRKKYYSDTGEDALIMWRYKD